MCSAYSPYALRWEPSHVTGLVLWSLQTSSPHSHCSGNYHHCVEDRYKADSVYEGYGLLHLYCLALDSTKACNICCPQSPFSFSNIKLQSLSVSHTVKALLSSFLMVVCYMFLLVKTYLFLHWTILLFSKPSLGWYLVSTGICCVVRSPGPLLPVAPGLVSVALGCGFWTSASWSWLR